MKRILGGVVLAIAILIDPINVNAASSCSYSEQAELNEIAGNVKANYEAKRVIVDTVVDPDYPNETIDIYENIININILNIEDGIYVKVIDDQNRENATYYKKDTQDGIITIKQSDTSKIVNYNIEVYADKYSCNGELLRTFNLQTPMYNNYSESLACAENPDFYYCQQFLTTENISFDSFSQKINEYKENNEKEEQNENKEKKIGERIKEFYQNHKIIINIVVSVIVVAGVATTVILVKKRRGRVL